MIQILEVEEYNPAPSFERGSKTIVSLVVFGQVTHYGLHQVADYFSSPYAELSYRSMM